MIDIEFKKKQYIIFLYLYHFTKEGIINEDQISGWYICLNDIFG